LSTLIPIGTSPTSLSPNDRTRAVYAAYSDAWDTLRTVQGWTGSRRECHGRSDAERAAAQCSGIEAQNGQSTESR
jgi:hypothetical protein